MITINIAVSCAAISTYLDWPSEHTEVIFERINPLNESTFGSTTWNISGSEFDNSLDAFLLKHDGTSMCPIIDVVIDFGPE